MKTAITTVTFVVKSFLIVKQAKNPTTVQYVAKSFLIVRQAHPLLKIQHPQLAAKREATMRLFTVQYVAMSLIVHITP